jgi:hypothetical protein
MGGFSESSTDGDGGVMGVHIYGDVGDDGDGLNNFGDDIGGNDGPSPVAPPRSASARSHSYVNTPKDIVLQQAAEAEAQDGLGFGDGMRGRAQVAILHL